MRPPEAWKGRAKRKTVAPETTAQAMATRAEGRQMEAEAKPVRELLAALVDGCKLPTLDAARLALLVLAELRAEGSAT